MNREELIRMARESGWEYATDDRGFEPLWRFAALVAVAERDACVKEALAADDQGSVNQRLMQKRIAAAIRARGQA